MPEDKHYLPLEVNRTLVKINDSPKHASPSILGRPHHAPILTGPPACTVTKGGTHHFVLWGWKRSDSGMLCLPLLWPLVANGFHVPLRFLFCTGRIPWE